MPGPTSPSRGASPEFHESTLTLTELNQVRVLADPLRVRMLGEFLEEHTTRQVAEALGEKPTRLYHHVDALEKAGLIRMTRTRRNRGTLERYYRAVACAFRADPSLFSPSGPGSGDASLRAMIRSILDQASTEIGALIATGQGRRGTHEEGCVAFLEIQGSDAELSKIRDRVAGLIAGLRGKAAGKGRRRTRLRRYRLCLAFFPLDLPRRDDPPAAAGAGGRRRPR